jgi:hypothetical protein
MRFCVQREGAAHLRDRLTLLIQLYSRNCDYLMVKSTSLRHNLSVRKFAEGGSLFVSRCERKFRYSRSLPSVGGVGESVLKAAYQRILLRWSASRSVC